MGLKITNLSHFRTLLSVAHLNIFALGGNHKAQNRINSKKIGSNDYAATL